MFKKLLGVLILLILLVGAGLFYLNANINPLVKAAVEKYGTEATQAQTTLAAVNVSPKEGSALLEGFNLANPAGFSTPSAMSFSKVKVAIDPNSIMGTGPIIINEVLIEAPEITYEVLKDGSNNLAVIQKNVEAYAASLKKTAAKVQGDAAPAQEDASSSRKLIIKSLLITDGRIKLSHALLNGANAVDAKLPKIALSNLGQAEGGLSPAMITKVLLTVVTKTATMVASSQMVNQLKNQGLDSLKGAVQESGVGNVINGILGK